MEPLAGGYGGETYATTGPAGERLVVRIYAREPSRCVVDAALLRLARGILPVAEVVEVRPPERDLPGVLVTSWLPGERGDLVLAASTPQRRAEIGGNLGRLLARLSGIPMPRFGVFTGGELRIADGVPTDLVEWAGRFRDTGRLAAWADRAYDSLLALLDEAEGVLVGPAGDPVSDGRPAYDRRVLVHSDFNPKNLLVDPSTGQVTGLLDWEFAHAGSPYADLGNLTRFDREPAYVEAVLDAFRTAAPALAPDPLTLGRAADLWALVELAGGGRVNPVRLAAQDLLLAQARSGDLHAWPWQRRRVDPGVADRIS